MKRRIEKNNGSIDHIEDKINRQNIRKSYSILYFSVSLIVVILGVISYFYFGESMHNILKDTVGNLVGVLAAFLVFDIINERLSKDSYSQELTKNILHALMAKPETLDSFTQEQRNLFIVSTVKSSVKDDDCAEMISDQCLNYLRKSNFDKIRLNFDYKFEIYEKLPGSCNWLNSSNSYYYVQEILGYKVKYFDEGNRKIKGNTAYIGFLFDNKNLDSALRDASTTLDFNKCIFRENLDINIEDISYLMSLPGAELLSLFKETFRFDFQVDQKKGILQDVQITEIGILAKFSVDVDEEINEHNVRIIFHMPKSMELFFRFL